MNKEQIVYNIHAKRILLEHEQYQGKKKTKRDEAVLQGKLDVLNSLISLIEYYDNKEIEAQEMHNRLTSDI
jgi:hypothetical protein